MTGNPDLDRIIALLVLLAVVGTVIGGGCTILLRPPEIEKHQDSKTPGGP